MYLPAEETMNVSCIAMEDFQRMNVGIAIEYWGIAWESLSCEMGWLADRELLTQIAQRAAVWSERIAQSAQNCAGPFKAYHRKIHADGGGPREGRACSKEITGAGQSKMMSVAICSFGRAKNTSAAQLLTVMCASIEQTGQSSGEWPSWSVRNAEPHWTGFPAVAI
jgi:hypothetical protein